VLELIQFALFKAVTFHFEMAYALQAFLEKTLVFAGFSIKTWRPANLSPTPDVAETAIILPPKADAWVSAKTHKSDFQQLVGFLIRLVNWRDEEKIKVFGMFSLHLFFIFSEPWDKSKQICFKF
jgi:hypothetical protein